MSAPYYARGAESKAVIKHVHSPFLSRDTSNGIADARWRNGKLELPERAANSGPRLSAEERSVEMKRRSVVRAKNAM